MEVTVESIHSRRQSDKVIKNRLPPGADGIAPRHCRVVVRAVAEAKVPVVVIIDDLMLGLAQMTVQLIPGCELHVAPRTLVLRVVRHAQ